MKTSLGTNTPSATSPTITAQSKPRANSLLKQFARVSTIHNSAVRGVRAHYKQIGLLEVSVPVLVGITGACENISTLFKVHGNSRIHLTQTGQLALEQALQIRPGVCCITKSFRTDHIDARHLNEFTLIEEEVGWMHPSAGTPNHSYTEERMFDVLLDHVTLAIRAIISAILEDTQPLLEEIGVPINRLEAALTCQFPRVSYTEAINLLQNTGQFDALEWGQDLKSEHENKILEILSKDLAQPLPIFITRYPEAIKFFNMKVSDTDPRVVNSADLLLPGVGETVGSAVREHNYDKLVQRLTSSVMFAHIQEQGIATIDDFAPYLEVIKNNHLPHAGYGIGLERVIQYVLAENDIRRSSNTYLLSELMGFNRQLAAMQTGSNAPGF